MIRTATVTTRTDPSNGPSFADVPLPGLDLSPPGPSSVPPRRSRPYSSTLPPTRAAINAFWSRVIKAPGHGCWIWAGAISAGDGYGRITWRSGGVSRTESAHRFALLLAGELTEGAVGEHRCNEPLCVRVAPEHLIASTQAANLRYAVACGRTGIIRDPVGHRDRCARSLAVRDALAGGWDSDAYAHASANAAPLNAPKLF